MNDATKIASPFHLIAVFSLASLLSSHAPGAPAQPLPHITIDTKKKIVDLDAKVVLREGDWIELLGCAVGTREHESIVVIHAKASHVHTALMLVGHEPGSCIRWTWDGQTPHIIPPHGDRIAVHVVLQKDGKEVEVPANQWIVNKEQQKTVPDNVWLFTGSSILEVPDPDDPNKVVNRYRGDIEGNIISVVNFGDEVLGRPTQVTDKDDKGMLTVNTPKVPEVGTKVKVRLRAADPIKPGAVLAIGQDGSLRLDKNPADAADLAGRLTTALDKAGKDKQRIVKIEAHAKAPPTAYAPVLEAIAKAKAEMWHVVVSDEAR